jgi:ubiquinone/menaquinone biosynthesis C-methylase UbiE
LPDAAPARANFGLKEEIRAYWSRRAETFDTSSGHGIRTPAERAAWHDLLGGLLGPAKGGRVLELAYGTGEVTGVLLDLGCDVTGLDLAEPMQARARAKHAGRIPPPRLHLGDAEDTREPDASYDAVVCRHLVWTLTDPAATFAEWLRVLRPGGRLVIIDGDWERLTPTGWLFRAGAEIAACWTGHREPEIDWEAHGRIMRQVHFRNGVRPHAVRPLLEAAGFTGLRTVSLAPVRRAQRRNADWAVRLRAGMFLTFGMTADRPAAPPG